MTNIVLIVAKPTFDLATIRNLFNKFSDIDLTTHCGTSISVLNKLICEDEYRNCNTTLKQHIYTLAVICDSWVLLRLHSIFDKSSFYSSDTKNDNYKIVLICGSLHDFIEGICENCTKGQERNLLSVFNNMILAFERESLGQLLKDYNKIKTNDGFYLEKK